MPTKILLNNQKWLRAINKTSTNQTEMLRARKKFQDLIKNGFVPSKKDHYFSNKLKYKLSEPIFKNYPENKNSKSFNFERKNRRNLHRTLRL